MLNSDDGTCFGGTFAHGQMDTCCPCFCSHALEWLNPSKRKVKNCWLVSVSTVNVS